MHEIVLLIKTLFTLSTIAVILVLALFVGCLFYSMYSGTRSRNAETVPVSTKRDTHRDSRNIFMFGGVVSSSIVVAVTFLFFGHSHMIGGGHKYFIAFSVLGICLAICCAELYGSLHNKRVTLPKSTLPVSRNSDPLLYWVTSVVWLAMAFHILAWMLVVFHKAIWGPLGVPYLVLWR